MLGVCTTPHPSHCSKLPLHPPPPPPPPAKLLPHPHSSYAPWSSQIPNCTQHDQYLWVSCPVDSIIVNLPKGTQLRTQTGLKMHKIFPPAGFVSWFENISICRICIMVWKYFNLQDLYCGSINMHATLLLWNWALQGAVHLVYSLIMKTRKWLGCDVWQIWVPYTSKYATVYSIPNNNSPEGVLCWLL